jgi:hypothetical protein
MTEMATMDGPEAKPARRRKLATVTATALGAHLDLTRQRVSVMVDEGIIRREADGNFAMDECRVLYLRWLRDPARRSQRSAADQAFLKAKTTALEVRTAQRLGELVPTEAAFAAIDAFAAAATAEIQSISARVAPTDLALRRKIDAAVHEARKAIHARLVAKVEEFEREGAADAGDD